MCLILLQRFFFVFKDRLELRLGGQCELSFDALNLLLDLFRLDVLQEGGQKLVLALARLVLDPNLYCLENLLLVNLLLVVLVYQQLLRLL